MKTGSGFQHRFFQALRGFEAVFNIQHRLLRLLLKLFFLYSCAERGEAGKISPSLKEDEKMKFTCEKHLLQAAVSAASRAASARSSIPALEGLLVQAGANVRITGYDLRKGIYQTVEAEVSEPGSAVIMTAKLLGEMMRVLPDGMVTVEVADGGKTTIKCGMSEYSFMSLPESYYTELPEADYSNAISLKQSELAGIIDETIFAVSTNESRPVYMGSLFELEGNRLTVVAVDGYRLALRRAEVSGKTESARFIVPGSVLQDVARLCSKGDETVMIDLGERHVSFSMGDTVVFSRLLEGDFLNYRKTIPENFRYKLGVSRGEMLSATDRVSLVVDETVKSPIRLTFSDGVIDFKCNTSLGTARDICTCTGDGGETEIGFNGRYLRDALKNAPADELTVCINSGSAPCVIVPADGNDGFVYMVLPVRLAK